MAYADYQYYTEEYYGSKLSETEFPKYAKRASAEIDHVTFGRIQKLSESEITDAIRDCTCEVAEKLKYFETSAGAEVASENNDGYSVSYRDTSNVDTQAHEIMASIRTYLGQTGLMYRGWHRKHDLCDS